MRCVIHPRHRGLGQLGDKESLPIVHTCHTHTRVRQKSSLFRPPNPICCNICQRKVKMSVNWGYFILLSLTASHLLSSRSQLWCGFILHPPYAGATGKVSKEQGAGNTFFLLKKRKRKDPFETCSCLLNLAFLCCTCINVIVNEKINRFKRNIRLLRNVERQNVLFCIKLYRNLLCLLVQNLYIIMSSLALRTYFFAKTFNVWETTTSWRRSKGKEGKTKVVKGGTANAGAEKWDGEGWWRKVGVMANCMTKGMDGGGDNVRMV